MIRENVNWLRLRIEKAASRARRDPQSIKIVAAAKTQIKTVVEEAVMAGVTIIGHNYVQEAIRERPDPQCGPFEYHMIGHLQRNKARKAAEIFDVIQTLDNGATAEALDRAAIDLDRRLGVMIQINLASEPQKSGVSEEDTPRLINMVKSLNNLKLLGLMTMPPFFDDPAAARPFFRRLRELRDNFIDQGIMNASATELSMGMTGDFEAAVEEGATLVRIGTALFGPRS
ncbi:MAG: YggS family pyridoxal phosphate-dependent enzyme [Desulfomonilaceae bacterium]